MGKHHHSNMLHLRPIHAGRSSAKWYYLSCWFVAGSLALAATAQATDLIRYVSPAHVFTMDDVIRDFDGVTYADDQSFICGLGGIDCPPDGPQPTIDQGTGAMLYPINNTFGFKVTDFVGAAELDLILDPAYEEGFVGNLTDSQNNPAGIVAATAGTKRFKTRSPMGTWCRGVGALDVKCSTEHYAVMEHVLSCYETLPYFSSDPETGVTKPTILPVAVDHDGDPLTPPVDTITPDCGALDNQLFEVIDGIVQNNCDGTGNPAAGCVPLQPDASGAPGVAANESTVLNDIAVGRNYAITKKDDGKALYRWGSIVKRPTDVRLYARIPLPPEWKQGEVFEVITAELYTDHNISNNPNDQIRPEDYENEGATGRLPEYIIIAPDDPLTPVNEEEWVSARDCFEGDGDFIEAAEDLIPTPIGMGTYFKNYLDEQSATPWADPSSLDSNDQTAGGTPLERDPLPYSSDLSGGFTNAWYTTIDRDPFEGYQRNIVNDQDNVIRSIASGPRWRLKSNKFGQDIPGLEIPLAECSPTPFTQANIKYPVGEPTTTVINLLDWETDNLLRDSQGNPINPLLDENGNPVIDPFGNVVATSPLASTRGWTDADANINQTAPGSGITINGLPLTDDFDLAYYFKGERKAVAIRSAFIDVTYRLNNPFDWGDAPEQIDSDGDGIADAPGYPTTAANNGPSHAITDSNFDGRNDLTLGFDADPEFDGQPDLAASGDDLTGFDNDEDGITFSSGVFPGKPASVIVVANAPGLLNAWIDFNSDGSWAGFNSIDPVTGNPVFVDEQIFSDQPVNTGSNILSFTVPSQTDYVTTYARFRINSAGGLSFTGTADDGEVEDYRLTAQFQDLIFIDGFES
ncbi:MAG: hypothetical protein Tsb002_02300 [Wenzhouxiangellaceae bacterium]